LAIGARRSLGCRLLTVDSLPGSEPFYLRLGFVRNKVAPEEEACPICNKPLNTCPHCGVALELTPSPTISMRFDLKTDPLPAWAAEPLGGHR
jgi:hypothetical protein